MNRDLTVGNPGKILISFCLPLFGSIVFQQLYNIADSFVAGKFISEDALAAVGNSYEITLIFIAFAFGCNIGCSVITSRLFGARDYTKVKSAVYTSLISTTVTCLILMIIGLVSIDGLLSLINTPENIYADSALYLDIYIWGLPSSSYTMSRPESSRPSVTAGPRSSFLLSHPRRTSSWISSSSQRSGWELPELHGRHSSARA